MKSLSAVLILTTLLWSVLALADTRCTSDSLGSFICRDSGVSNLHASIGNIGRGWDLPTLAEQKKQELKLRKQQLELQMLQMKRHEMRRQSRPRRPPLPQEPTESIYLQIDNPDGTTCWLNMRTGNKTCI